MPSSQDTPFLTGWRAMLAPLGRRSRPVIRSVAAATLSQIEDQFGPALGSDFLKKPKRGAFCRERLYPLRRVFWSWLWQILQANSACRHAVRQIQALLLRTSAKPDEGTTAYCLARRKMPLTLIEQAFHTSARRAEEQAPGSTLLQSRALKVIDGSAVRLQDTPANAQAYPPVKNQHDKPTFPMLKVLALFSALSGAIVGRATDSLDVHELRLMTRLQALLQPNDIVIGDRQYGCYVALVWLKNQLVDFIGRVPTRSRKVDFRKAVKRLGPGDALFVWNKPLKPSAVIEAQDWQANFPEKVTVRVIRARVAKNGFRTTEITVVTTLLDPQMYPAEQILAGFLKRWRMEMCIDDLKTTLRMEQLKCKTPKMVEKELLMFLTLHNLIRWVMGQAAQHGQMDLERISFKGTIDAFDQWSLALARMPGRRNINKRAVAWCRLLETLAADALPLRPGRQQPRAVKRRSKYPTLNKPRHRFVERWSRNKRRLVARAKKYAALN